MIELEDRVTNLEEVLAEHIRRTDQILGVFAESISAIREGVAEIRASNARTDHQLLILQQQADKDRQQAERIRQHDREEAQRIRQHDREEAERIRQQHREEAERIRQHDRKEAEEKWQQAEKERKEFNRRLAEITDSQGLMIENMVFPNLKRIAAQIFGGVPSEFEAIRLRRRKPSDPGRQKELDLLAVAPSPGPVLICEAKSKPTSEKVSDFIESLGDFAEYFPEYAGRRVVPMMASIWFDPSLVQFMTNQGVVALGFGDETMEVLNPEAVDQVLR